MNDERQINDRLAECLRTRNPAWAKGDKVMAESTRVIVDEPLKRPDVLIRSDSPVIVEAEIDPAPSVDKDALERLGRRIVGMPRAVEAVVALIYPAWLTGVEQDALLDCLGSAKDLRWYVFFQLVEGDSKTVGRFPASGEIEGSLDDLAGVIEALMISPQYLDETADTLESTVADASAFLDTLDDKSKQKISGCLHQIASEQSMRMASAVVANAFLSQVAISQDGSVPNIDQTRDRGGSRGLRKRHVLDVWDEILDVNYWPIYGLATDILTIVPDGQADAFCDRLAGTAQDLAASGVVEVQDLAGQMLGKLISDRKFLATFYTRPESAALLAELAVSRLDVDWSDQEDIRRLRVADLACGTGALLSAAYRRMSARHRRRGNDPSHLHAAMMRHSLIGADVMPAAAHLTTMMLSAAHPAVPFDSCEIHVVRYGLTKAGQRLVDQEATDDLTPEHVRLGSLELLADDATGSLIGQQSTQLAGQQQAVRDDPTAFKLPAEGVDLMIMNPPFTRATNHENRDERAPVPSFAGLSTPEAAQKKMSARLTKKSTIKRTNRNLPAPIKAAHGNAGLASNFIDLAHHKLRPNGVLALILPAQIIAGDSWEGARRLLSENYRDILVATVASADSSTSRAFSADTGMAEAIVIATKNPAAQTITRQVSKTATYVSLFKRPGSLLEAHETARAIQSTTSSSAAKHLRIGQQSIGWIAESPFRAEVRGHPAGVHSAELAAAAKALADQSLLLPRIPAVPIPTIALEALGTRGPYHLDISGPVRNKQGQTRGPFKVNEIDRSAHASLSWPVLRAHDHTAETRMALQPDAEGTPQPGQRQRAEQLWAGTADRAGATRLHVSADFRVNSQPVSACLTPTEALGGRAWPGFGVSPADDPQRLLWEKALCAWLNTTTGLIARWWVSGRQQKGRAILTVTTIGHILVPNLDAIPEESLKALASAYDDYADKPLLPANEAWQDRNRQSLDRAVLCEGLGLPISIIDPLDTLRLQWCAEPSVHGGKSTLPP